MGKLPVNCTVVAVCAPALMLVGLTWATAKFVTSNVALFDSAIVGLQLEVAGAMKTCGSCRPGENFGDFDWRR